LQPIPEKRPRLSAKCPACGHPKSSKEINCVNCGARACPSGHILSFDNEICSVCGWKDAGFKLNAGKPPKNSTVSSNTPELDEYTNHKIEFQCPRCHTLMEDKDVKCPNCGQLGDWKYKGVRGKMPPYLQTGDDSSSSKRRPK
jgi:RNA polymerase subunit RPABC4/transcription elongation factor Spt4